MNRVVWNSEKRVLIFPNGKYARGLTKTLLADFSPEFSARKALQSLDTRKIKRNGRKIGCRMDELMEKYVTKGIHTPKDPKFCYITEVLKKNRWIPYKAQVPVGSEELRLATRVDLIVKDVFGTTILLEIKCGFDDYFTVANQGNMLYPYDTIPASCQNHAYLQLLFTEYMYLQSFEEPNGIQSYLLHVFENADNEIQHTLTTLPDWCRNKEWFNTALGILKESRYTTSDDRKRALKNGQQRGRMKRNKIY